MHQLIALTLIEKGIMKAGTELEGFYKGVGLSGKATERVKGGFLLKQAKRLKSGKIFFEVVDTRDGQPRRIMCEDVDAIDGMDPDRAAQVAGFAVEGDKVVLLKKRGRKASLPDDEDDDEDDDAC